MMRGYVEAEKFEGRITKLLREYPIDRKENYLPWLNFLRTLQSTTDVLQNTILDNIRREDI